MDPRLVIMELSPDLFIVLALIPGSMMFSLETSRDSPSILGNTG